MSTFRRILQAVGQLYRRVFKQQLDPHIREIRNILQAVPVLSHLSSGALHAMAEACHRRTYRRGESLYYEGDPGLGLYVVESGRIRLVSDADPDRPRTLRELEVHEMFGGLSLLGDFRRLETAETITEARVLGFFRPDLKNVMRRNPQAGTEIVTAIARRVATQYVEAVRVIEEREGRDVALDIYAEASSRAESESLPLS